VCRNSPRSLENCSPYRRKRKQNFPRLVKSETYIIINLEIKLTNKKQTKGNQWIHNSQKVWDYLPLIYTLGWATPTLSYIATKKMASFCYCKTSGDPISPLWHSQLRYRTWRNIVNNRFCSNNIVKLEITEPHVIYHNTQFWKRLLSLVCRGGARTFIWREISLSRTLCVEVILYTKHEKSILLYHETHSIRYDTSFSFTSVVVYSVRGLERSELGGSHRRFLWQVYTPSKASCLLSFW